MMDASLLLPPTNTPLTGIEFNKRLPCGEEERARRVCSAFYALIIVVSFHQRSCFLLCDWTYS